MIGTLILLNRALFSIRVGPSHLQSEKKRVMVSRNICEVNIIVLSHTVI